MYLVISIADRKYCDAFFFILENDKLRETFSHL